MQMLNYQLISPSTVTEQAHPYLVLLHGLFGNKHNMNVICHEFQDKYHCLLIDLRNHGHSFHHQEHTYENMAVDVINLLNELGINKTSLVGHSMGGKLAMKLAQYIPDRITKLAILDIAPVAYHERKHDEVFAALREVKVKGARNRIEASEIMNQFDLPSAISQFLLKSFIEGKWQFNLDALELNYNHILGWDDINPVDTKTLFIVGAASNYVLPSYRSAIIKQFPQAKAHIINGADHWVHADKPQQVNRALTSFFLSGVP